MAGLLAYTWKVIFEGDEFAVTGHSAEEAMVEFLYRYFDTEEHNGQIIRVDVELYGLDDPPRATFDVRVKMEPRWHVSDYEIVNKRPA